MRFKFSLPFKRSIHFPHLGRLLFSFSVRTRIIVLALVPVAGFLANGLTYVAGERDVGVVVKTANQSRQMADASRDFKIAVAAMRIAAKDFTVAPHGTLVDAFDASQDQAGKHLDIIAHSIGGMRADDIAALRELLGELKDNFAKLVAVQRKLGFSETEGLRNDLRNSGNDIERAINENMTWLAETDSKKLMLALLTMQHYEAEYRLNQSELMRQLFVAGYDDFTATFSKVDGTPEMKQKLEHEVKFYADAFAHWIELSDQANPLRALIDIDSQNMLPRADAIIASANGAAARASAALSTSQARTRNGIIAVGIAMVALGLGFCWLIGRSITRPLNGLAGVMKRLADGDTTARIPATHARDEIGEMARTVIVFRDTMVEREKLAADAGRSGRDARGAQRYHRADHRPVQAFGRQRAGQVARAPR